jgi:hypothetical protein
MRKVWLRLGIALSFVGCSSDTPTAPGAAAASMAGRGAPASAGVPAAAGGGGHAPAPAAGRGSQGGAGIAQNAAGNGSAGAPQAGRGSAAGAAGGRPGAGAQAGGGAVSGSAAAGTGGSSGATSLAHFSFFITSLAGMQKLSGKQEGFGGDLRYGQADGLAGADKICSDLAESSMQGAAAKGWRAFLSVAQGPDGAPVHAIDRVGQGPWYDRAGRIVAMTKAALLNPRPQGADAAIINDLPNEDGLPNQTPDPGQPPVNNHHILTGSDTSGKLYNGSVNSTCNNWTSTAQSAGRPRIGFSYPAGNRQHWISGQDEGGCGAGAVLVDRGGSDPSNPIVGSGGGYGGIYCLALMP